jgi:hypothetical protein
MKRLRVYEKPADIDGLDLRLEDYLAAPVKTGDIVVEIRAAGVNPSDDLAAYARARLGGCGD